jgi:hypothetical protein
VRAVEHMFRPKRPRWLVLNAVLGLGLSLAFGYLVSWRLAVFLALMAVGQIAVRPRQLRLERDENGAAHLVAGGRRDSTDVDLSRLVAVDTAEGAFRLRDEGAELVGPLDRRLRAEVHEAAGRRRLALSPETETALLADVPDPDAFKGVFRITAVTSLLPLAFIGVMVLLGPGVEPDRDHEVTLAELRVARSVAGAVSNPFADRPAAELYLVALDAESQERFAELGELLRLRFGMRPAVAPPLSLQDDMLDQERDQLDGWKITDRLIQRYQLAHPGRPAILIAVVDLDTFNPNRPDDRFAFLTSGATDRNVVCGGVISTDRFDLWPGSERTRLAKMASRLLARCLFIHEDVSIRSVSDVDGLDDRAGASVQAIARRVAERRALQGAPLSR